MLTTERRQTSKRLPHIDCLRGVAVVCMVLWHTIDAWTLTTDRTSAAFSVVLFAAGWAAPLFLLLAGVSLALAGDAWLGRGLDRTAASRQLQRRGWQVFLLAHLFRFQSFVLNPNSTWSAIFKPDILNVLGLGMVLTAVLWTRVRTVRQGLLWLVTPALVAAFVLTPLSREWAWPDLLHPRLEAYIRPNGGYGVFSLFPTIAYVPVGAFLGGMVAASRDASGWLWWRLALVGVVLLVVGNAAAFVDALQIPTPTDAAPAFIWRVGAMTLAFAVAWALLTRWPSAAWAPLITLGQTSLFVYWVHVEIAYGAFSYPIRQSLTLMESLVCFALFLAALTVLATLWRRRRRGPLIPDHMRAGATPEARIAGVPLYGSFDHSLTVSGVPSRR